MLCHSVVFLKYNEHPAINFEYYLVCFFKYNIRYFIFSLSLLPDYSYGSFLQLYFRPHKSNTAQFKACANTQIILQNFHHLNYHSSPIFRDILVPLRLTNIPFELAFTSRFNHYMKVLLSSFHSNVCGRFRVYEIASSTQTLKLEQCSKPCHMRPYESTAQRRVLMQNSLN